MSSFVKDVPTKNNKLIFIFRNHKTIICNYMILFLKILLNLIKKLYEVVPPMTKLFYNTCVYLIFAKNILVYNIYIYVMYQWDV